MNPQVNSALQTLNHLIPLVEEAESQFKSARNWSFLDLFGGGFIIDMIKHYKLNKASNIMSEVNYLLQQLSHQLNDINIPQDFRMQMNGFVTFADFVFDGILVDAYMTSKIMTSLDQIRRLKSRLYSARENLQRMM